MPTGALRSTRGGSARSRWIAGGAVAAVLGGFALYWFAPWNLVVDRRVDETAPAVRPDAAPPSAMADDPAAARAASEVPAGGDPGPATISRGAFRDLEHATSGTVLILKLEDGSRFVRLEDLDTSNGPDLRVILSSEPPQEDWHVYDDGAYLDLGPLKGNLGSSNYAIPADAELERFASAVVWCRRFSVGFGVAPIS